MQQEQRTPEQDIEILYAALEEYYHLLKEVDEKVTHIQRFMHDFGNMITGKVGAAELEILVKQLVLDELKQRGAYIG